MVEGFWIVQYEGIQGNGGGVVVFLKGHVLGGDNGFIYTGRYKNDEKESSARVLIRNFLPEVASVLGVQGDFELILNGTATGQVIKSLGECGESGSGGNPRQANEGQWLTRRGVVTSSVVRLRSMLPRVQTVAKGLEETCIQRHRQV